MIVAVGCSSPGANGQGDLMKVSVKLFSILREYVPDYSPQMGIAADLEDGATVSDLLSHLGIPITEAPVVTCNGRVLRYGDIVQKDSKIDIFQPVAGG
jgi:sulfur carrier protein ThiS